MAKVQQCDATTLDWASLVITIISINVTWWIVDIPKLWQSGIGAYVDAITWQCLRVSMPSVACVYAIYYSVKPYDMPKLYYYGFHLADERTPMSTFEYLKVAISDTISLVATCVTIYKTCHIKSPDGASADVSGWNASMWTYPTLPVVINGLVVIAASAMKLNKKWVFPLAIFFLAIVCVAFTLILYYLSPLGENGTWYASMIMYIYMALPVALLPNIPLQIVSLSVTVVTRVAGVGVGAISSRAYFPFCELKNNAFGGTYLAFGILAALLAIYGQYKWNPVRYSLMPKRLWAGNKTIVRYGRADQDEQGILAEESGDMPMDTLQGTRYGRVGQEEQGILTGESGGIYPYAVRGTRV